MSRTKRVLITASIVVFISNITIASPWREHAKAIDISGGEDHTLVVTANNWGWACGPNGCRNVTYYYGVLGTASNDPDLEQKVLVRIHGPGDVGYLEGIWDIDAGWQHSLALDVNDSVWSWGWNNQGQLGIGLGGPEAYSTSPVPVLRGEQADDPCEASDYLKHIIAISAGRSGLHSLAMDANGYAYGWGYNAYGQCGNDANNWDELTPVYVHQGAQPADSNDESNRLKQIVDICAGSNNSIALEADLSADTNSLFEGCVYTWGCNMWGEEPCDVGIVSLGRGLLGTASDVNFSDTPVKVLAGAQHLNDPNQPYLNHIVAVAAGWDHCMAVENDDPWDPNLNGRVYTWGNNTQSEKNPDLERIFVEFLEAHLV